MVLKENKNYGCFGPELVEVAMLLFTFYIVNTLRAIAIKFKSFVLVVTDNTYTYIYVITRKMVPITWRVSPLRVFLYLH